MNFRYDFVVIMFLVLPHDADFSILRRTDCVARLDRDRLRLMTRPVRDRKQFTWLPPAIVASQLQKPEKFPDVQEQDRL